MSSLLLAAGAFWLERLWPLTLATAVALGGAAALDRLLERRVRAALRMMLYAAPFFVAIEPGRLLGGVSGNVVPSPLRAAWDLAPLSIRADAVSSGAMAAGALYASVLALLLGRWIWARVRIGRALGHGQPVDPIVVHPSLGPAVIGILKPRIVIPASLLTSLDEASLARIVRHERAHIDRRDPILAAIVQLATFAAWPLVPIWLAGSRVRRLIEMACDEVALGAADPAERRAYGETLLAMAEAPAQRAIALAFGADLTARVRALRWRPRWPVALEAIVCAALAIGILACSGPVPPVPPEPESRTAAVPPVPQVAPTPAAVPAPSASAPEREGRLNKEIIRRVIMRHINEVKYCYDQGLLKKPDLIGGMTVEFTIASSGKVVAATLDKSTLDEPAVESCAVAAVKTWEFPKPEGGGVVIVKYPFVFTN